MYSPERLPNDARRTARNLGELQFRQHNWSNAYDALCIAAVAAERLYAGALTEEGKIAEIEENARIYQWLVEICLRLVPAHNTEGLLRSEEGRSRLFRTQLETVALPAPRGVPTDQLERERALLKALRNLENVLRSMSEETLRLRLVEEALTVREQLTELWDRFVDEYDAGAYVGLRRSEKLTFDDVRTCLQIQTA